MTKENHIELNAITGESNVIELTDKEIQDRKKLAVKNEADFAAKEQATIAAKQGVLDRLGITAEEAALLLK
jgi:hypothetical protein